MVRRLSSIISLWHYDCSGINMQNNFDINYQGKAIPVTYESGNQLNTFLFTVNLPEGAKKLQCQKDNEGAYRWLNEDGSASDGNKEIGEAIETYLVQHQITL